MSLTPAEISTVHRAAEQYLRDAGIPAVYEEPATHSRWCVHVIGPDDVLPAASRQAAVLHAHALNAAMVARLSEWDEDGLYPTCWAVPTSYEAFGVSPQDAQTTPPKERGDDVR